MHKYTNELFNFIISTDKITKYQVNIELLLAKFPNIEILFEKLLVNQLYFHHYPLSNDQFDLLVEYQSICGTYLFMDYISVAYIDKISSFDDLVDILSATFRIIKHSGFNNIITNLLINEKINYFDSLSTLMNNI